jgi:hypothetical protein
MNARLYPSLSAPLVQSDSQEPGEDQAIGQVVEGTAVVVGTQVSPPIVAEGTTVSLNSAQAIWSDAPDRQHEDVVSASSAQFRAAPNHPSWYDTTARYDTNALLVPSGRSCWPSTRSWTPRARGTCTIAKWSLCLAMSFALGLILPAYLISAVKLAKYSEPSVKFGPLAGLQEQESACKIAAVYHRNIVSHHMVHKHHPHHPHHPHSPHHHYPHHHSPSGRRLSRDLGGWPAAAPPSAPSTRERHQHSPTAFRVAAEETQPAVEAQGEAQGEIRQGQVAAPLPTHPSDARASLSPQDVCYDRWVFAFSPGAAVGSDAGEALSATRKRLLSRGWAELESAGGDDDDVVLSAPLNRRRECDFSYKVTGPDLFSRDAPDRSYGTYTYVEPASVQYSPPSANISCSDLGSWFTNPWESHLLEGDGGGGWRPFSRHAPPWPEWRFNPRAPSAWELSQLDANAILGSKELMGPPQLSMNASLCHLHGDSPISRIVSHRVTSGCAARDLPGSWGDSCPLRVGGELQCWYMGDGNASGAEGYHGCGPQAPVAGAETLSGVAQRVAGAAPPNPFCMTIFPPSWRVADWYVATWLQELMDFDPYPMFLAGVILSAIFLSFFCLTLLIQQLRNWR